MRNLIFILAGLLTLGSVVYQCEGYGNKQTVTVKVTGKERITESTGDKGVHSYYLIYSDSGTYKLEDDLFYGNFNSSDWYGRIHEGKTYKFDLIGYRIGWLSSYQNIIKVENK
jgi:hypothetical protein